MTIFAQDGDPIPSPNPPRLQCSDHSRNLGGKFVRRDGPPSCLGSAQHATGLVTAGYREKNVIEGLNAHASKVEVKAFIDAAQLSHGGHDGWEITAGLDSNGTHLSAYIRDSQMRYD